MYQLAQVLGRKLGDAVDVLRNGHHILSYPGCRLALARHERPTKCTGGTRVHKSIDSRRDRHLQQIQRPADVRVDEILTRVSLDMRLVEGGRVQNTLDIAHAALDEAAVGDGSHIVRKGRGFYIDADG